MHFQRFPDTIFFSFGFTCKTRHALNFTCCGWLLTFFAAAITASAADGFPAIGLAANKAWWCDCTCCLFKWCCNCWCCKCAAATAAGKWGWWWLIVAVSEAIEYAANKAWWCYKNNERMRGIVYKSEWIKFTIEAVLAIFSSTIRTRMVVIRLEYKYSNICIHTCCVW